MDRLPRTIAHLLITLAIANVIASVTHLRPLDLVSHAQFLTLSIGVAVAANRARTLGMCALALLLTGPLFLVACSLGAGLAVGLVLRETIGVPNGLPQPPDAPARTADRLPGPDWHPGDPFGITRANDHPVRRPTRDRSGDDPAPDGRGRTAY